MKVQCIGLCGGVKDVTWAQADAGACPDCGGRIARPSVPRDPEKALGRSPRARAKAVERDRRRRRAISEASDAQRAKVQEFACVVTGELAIEGALLDPAHLCARAHGGCDDPLCVVPLRRDHHRLFDEGQFDLYRYLRPHADPRRYLPELQHALDHYDGDVIGLLHRLTGERYVPERTIAA